MKTKRRASHSLQKQLAMLALFLPLVMAISGCQSDRVGPLEASPTRSMKGYELYSWQMQGDWYFALVVGTNRIKTYDEISSPEVCVQGFEALEHELDQLPSGEQVFWSIQRVPNRTLPPDEMLDEVRTYCRQRGIQLVIKQTPLPDDAMEATTMPPVIENANQATNVTTLEATPCPAIEQTPVSPQQPDGGLTCSNIPEVSIEVCFPQGYSLSKNAEVNRRGSFVSYDLRPLDGYQTPYLSELQFFSEESISEFTRDCDKGMSCFFGDHPDLERYYGQREALRKLEGYHEFALQSFNGRPFLAVNRPCYGDTCILREYTTFLDDIKLDIWIVMEDESQTRQSDQLLARLIIQDGTQEGSIERIATPDRAAAGTVAPPKPMPATAELTLTPADLPGNTYIFYTDPKIFHFEVTPARIDPGDTITLTWQASGDRATICPSARFVLFTSDDCQQVPLSGTTTFTIPLEAAGFHFIDFILSVETHGSSTPEVWPVSVALKCPMTWFFSDEPQAGVCPTGPIRSYAAAQRFERGTMIWIEQLGRYVILDETLHHFHSAARSDPLAHADTHAHPHPNALLQT